MPRFFVSTSGCPASREGAQVEDRDGLRQLLRRALAEILIDGEPDGLDSIHAEAKDEAGHTVMVAKISFAITDLAATP